MKTASLQSFLPQNNTTILFNLCIIMFIMLSYSCKKHKLNVFFFKFSPQSCGCCTSATPSLSSSSRREALPPPALRGYWTFSLNRSTSGSPSWSAPPTTSTSTCPLSRSANNQDSPNICIP